MYRILKNVTIGSDPELFIFNESTQKVVSSIGLIPGEKGKAYKPEGFEEGFGLQIDNILAEFNIPPVSINMEGAEDTFVQHMNKMKNFIKEYVAKANKNYTILCSASELIDDDQLQSAEAKLFGCSPDYNVYTLEENPRPRGTETNMRSTGMHIHIGYDSPTLDTSIALLKVMDLFLGVPSVLIDPDTRRRSLYGKAGCFRLTEYGIEYRVLSGYFLKDDKHIRWVYQQTVKAIEFYNKILLDSHRWTGNIEDYLPKRDSIENSINVGSTVGAKRTVNRFNINYKID